MTAIKRTVGEVYQGKIRDDLGRVVCLMVDVLQNMPLAQGVLVILALSVVLGTFAYSGLELISQVMRIFTTVTVLGIGSLTLWILQYDRRKTRNIIRLGVVLLMATNVVYLMDIDLVSYRVLQDLTAMVMVVTLFLSAAHGFYVEHPKLHRRAGSMERRHD